MKRISVAGLMGVVTLCGVGFAAVVDPNEYWSSGVLLITLGVLGYAALASLYRRGPARAGWAGFILFGGAYFFLTTASVLSPSVLPRLPTTHLIRYCDRFTAVHVPKAELDRLTEERRLAVLKSKAVPAGSSSGSTGTFPWSTASGLRGAAGREIDDIDRALSSLRFPYQQKNQAVSAARQLVGHNLFAIVAGLIGAALAMWMDRGPERELPPASDQSP